MPSEHEIGLPELRRALEASEKLEELQACLAVVYVKGAKHARRLAATVTAFLECEDPQRFWYFPHLSNHLLADTLSGTLFRISSKDPDPIGRAKAARLFAKLAEF